MTTPSPTTDTTRAVSSTRPLTGAGSDTLRSRRNMLGFAAAAGVATTLAACTNDDALAGRPGGSATTGSTVVAATIPPTTAVPSGGTAPAVTFFADESFDYDAVTALGEAAYGISEVGEVITAINTINAAGPTYQTFTDTFLAWADDKSNQAVEAAGRGDAATSGEQALRAAGYYDKAMFYVLGTTHAADEADFYRKFRTNWDAAAPLLAPHVETVSIPYGDTPLPGWFFAPDDSGKARPTLILNNGSDGQASSLWAYGAAAAMERDWNALIFEGPGQGSLLFEHKVPFRDDWEKVISPVVDHLVARKDVDKDRIALFGLSMGGQLVTRAAAFEHRLAAVVTAPGVVDPWLGFPEELRTIVSKDKDTTNQLWKEFVEPAVTPVQKFLLQKRLEPYGAACIDAARRGELPADFWTPVQIVQAQNVTDVAKRVKAPVLVVDYELEAFYPGQADQLYSLLTGPKDLVKMTVAEGAQLHCSPMAPRVHNEVVFDWLEHTLR